MSYWKKADASTHGVDDMVLLTKTTDKQIVDNLHKRFMANVIYTYIGPVLIAVNPYKALTIFTQKEIQLYHGSVSLCGNAGP